MYDSVHLYKSNRNNWFNLKGEDKEFWYPPWDSVDDDTDTTLHKASFMHVRTLYKQEADVCLVSGFKLTHKAVYLNNFDKQKVALAEQLFAPSTIAALTGKEECEQTVEYMKIIRKWWDIVNVKSKNVGHRT